MALYVLYLEPGIRIITVLIVFTMLAFLPFMVALEYDGHAEIKMQDDCMHILALLLSSV